MVDQSASPALSAGAAGISIPRVAIGIPVMCDYFHRLLSDSDDLITS
jgi:hypothetical protein